MASETLKRVSTIERFLGNSTSIGVVEVDKRPSSIEILNTEELKLIRVQMVQAQNSGWGRRRRRRVESDVVVVVVVVIRCGGDHIGKGPSEKVLEGHVSEVGAVVGVGKRGEVDVFPDLLHGSASWGCLREWRRGCCGGGRQGG